MQSLAFAWRVHARDHFKALAYEIGTRVVFIETRIECAEFLGCLAEICLKVAQARLHDHEATDHRHEHSAHRYQEPSVKLHRGPRQQALNRQRRAAGTQSLLRNAHHCGKFEPAVAMGLWHRSRVRARQPSCRTGEFVGEAHRPSSKDTAPFAILTEPEIQTLFQLCWSASAPRLSKRKAKKEPK